MRRHTIGTDKATALLRQLKTWDPKIQAFADNGWAVAMVNYRGSTGRGRSWLDLTVGNPGRPEVEDLVAARAALIRTGIADPDRIAIAGSSWGGYLTLLTIGLVPDGWRAAVAFAPLADLVSAYDEQAASIRSLLHLLFGGSPARKPQLYADRSPISYAAQVRTPLLIVAGENDTRCPIRQVRNYIRRLEDAPETARLDHKLVIHPSGHTSLDADQRMRHVATVLEFTTRYIPGVGSAAT